MNIVVMYKSMVYVTWLQCVDSYFTVLVFYN